MSTWMLLYEEKYIKAITVLTEKRKEKNISQLNMARYLNTHQKTISNIENFRQEASLGYFLEICKILDIDFLVIMKIFVEK